MKSAAVAAIAAIVAAIIGAAGAIIAGFIARDSGENRDADQQPVRSHGSTQVPRDTDLPPPSAGADRGAAPPQSLSIGVQIDDQIEPEADAPAFATIALSRVDMLFRPAPNAQAPAQLYIGFRNSDTEPVRYRIVYIQVTIDGRPVRANTAPYPWMTLAPGDDIGYDLSIQNIGYVMSIGSRITARYRLEIGRLDSPQTEFRSEEVTKIVTSFEPFTLTSG